ncbi:MAG: phosphatase PAP2 family protein [Hymenobacter sp.]|nr:phosphatase PAP2 family protein [Hymenobacter sp.]
MPKLALPSASRPGLLTTEIVGGGLAFGLSIGLFFSLARGVLGQPMGALDEQAFAVADRWRAAAPWLTGMVLFVTLFGSLKFLLPASLLVFYWLRRRGHGRHVLALLLAMSSGWVLNTLLKGWFHRPRPTSALLYQLGQNQLGQSFPSGHAMLSIAFYGYLAWLLVGYGRRGWAAMLLGWAGLIGLTRVYLHVHYLTDVLAGFAGGVGWLLLLGAGLKALGQARTA